MSRPKDIRTLDEKFHQAYSIADSGCWEWTRGRNDQGYGGLYHAGKTIGAHRVSWEIHNGSIPKGQLVRHTCDNPPCVNPAHLELGTYLDNARDTVSRRRTLTGERNKFAKLTETQVLSIRASSSAGTSSREIAMQYRVSVRTVNDIVSRHTWTNL